MDTTMDCMDTSNLFNWGSKLTLNLKCVIFTLFFSHPEVKAAFAGLAVTHILKTTRQVTLDETKLIVIKNG